MITFLSIFYPIGIIFTIVLGCFLTVNTIQAKRRVMNKAAEQVVEKDIEARTSKELLSNKELVELSQKSELCGHELGILIRAAEQFVEKDNAARTSKESLSDRDLIDLVRKGNKHAMEVILSRYRYLVQLKVRSYFLIGADKEDLIQEGMIGLYKATQYFREDKDTSFKAFAELCITKQIITAIKGATRQKHLPLNQYVSLIKTFDDKEDSSLWTDVIPSDYVSDPVDLLITRKEIGDIKYSFIEMLSRLEATVLGLYMDGNTYQDIAAKMDREVKSINNALQRVKRKLDIYLAKNIADNVYELEDKEVCESRNNKVYQSKNVVG